MNNIGQTTDLILGQEFLTWLWYRGETHNFFKDRDGNDVAVTMEKRIVVQGGEGDMMETASVSGVMSELREARLGLTTGKKVTRAQVRFDQDQESWNFTLRAEDFALGGFKTPVVETGEEKDDDREAAFFEKIYLLDKGLGFFDCIYKEFLTLRLSATWKEEVKHIQSWMYQS